MHFDDRLATVLRNRATGERSARTQFRQLIDLLGERAQGEDTSLKTAAYLRLLALGDLISTRERTSIVGEAGWRFRNPELVRWFGDAHPHVAAAALARAQLTGDEWAQIIPNFPIHARGFLRNRKDLPESAVQVLDRLGVADRALPRPEPQDLVEEYATIDLPPAPAPLRLIPEDILAQTADGAEPEAPLQQTGESIRALVERIEAFKRRREERAADGEKTPAPQAIAQAESAALRIDFRTDTDGMIDWVDGVPAPSMIGMDLAASVSLAKLFGARLPIREESVTLRGAVAVEGDWMLDAVPRFSREEGLFRGYLGRLRRAVPSGVSSRQKEADKLRQLLHELRTPVNAMQGYAEIIQQQMIGPVPHEYRAIAAGITGDAARILAGFDELDRLARLETGTVDMESGECDFADVVQIQVGQLQNVLSPRVARIDAEFAEGEARVPLARGEAELVSWRLLATLAGATSAGERIALSMTQDAGSVAVSVALPTALRAGNDPFAAQTRAAAGPLSSGIFGAGFSLRLARAEARAAGGDLAYRDNRLELTLPQAGMAGAQAKIEHTADRATG